MGNIALFSDSFDFFGNLVFFAAINLIALTNPLPSTHSESVVKHASTSASRVACGTGKTSFDGRMDLSSDHLSRIAALFALGAFY